MVSHYSPDTLRARLADVFDSDTTNGRAPFARLDRFFWSRTSGLPIELVEQTMAEVAAARSTRVDPNSNDDEVVGK